MISFQTFLYLLAGMSLPAAYIYFVSRWIEAENRLVHSPPPIHELKSNSTPTLKRTAA